MDATTTEIIDNELHRQGRSRKWLIHEADIVQSSFEKAMSGQRPFPLPMLARIGRALGITFEATAVAPAVAPEALGAYSRAGARWLEGLYVAVRHAARPEGAVATHAVRIGWDEEAGCLRHYHSDDAAAPVHRRGEVSIPSRSGHIFLIVNSFGQYDLTIFAPPAEDGLLFGLSVGLVRRHGMPLPGGDPIALVPRADEGERFGTIEPGDPAYARYLRLLADAEAAIVVKPGSRSRR